MDAEATTTLPISEHECLPETRKQGQGGPVAAATPCQRRWRIQRAGALLAASAQQLSAVRSAKMPAVQAAERSSLSWIVILWSLRLRSHECAETSDIP